MSASEAASLDGSGRRARRDPPEGQHDQCRRTASGAADEGYVAAEEEPANEGKAAPALTGSPPPTPAER